MRKLMLIIALGMGIISQINGQNANSQFVVVGDASTDINMKQVYMRYKNLGNACFILSDHKDALSVIISELGKKGSVDDLHLFLVPETGVLVFNPQNVISVNSIQNYENHLKQLKKFVKEKIVVHSKNAFATYEGALLKKQLESFTGLIIVAE